MEPTASSPYSLKQPRGTALHTDTQRELITLASRFSEREAAAPETYPAESLADIHAGGWLGAPFPGSEGGHGWSLADATRAIELIAAGSPSVALLWSMPLGLAGIFSAGVDAAQPEWQARWEAQCSWAATQYRAGRIFAACNSEKGAGGSLDATKTRATLDVHGAWRIDGEKILASSGSYASWFLSTARVEPTELPGAGVVEFFLVPTGAQGVHVLADWDGFGMRSTESHSVRYDGATATAMLGFPDFIARMQPLQYWFCLFAAIPLGCARGILQSLGTPSPESPALRLRFNEALMRYEALRAYLAEVAGEWKPGAGPGHAARVLRAKTHVSQESTKLCAELFALSGGRHYRRGSQVARLLADAFAGTALRPPLALALDSLAAQFSLDEA